MRILLIILSHLICFNALPQSKKEQIEILTGRADSLNTVLGSERSSNINKVNELNLTIKTLENQITILTDNLSKLSSELLESKKENLVRQKDMVDLKLLIDKKSDSIRLISEETKNGNQKVSFSLDFIFSEEIITQFKKIAFKYPGLNSGDKKYFEINNSNLLISKLYFEDKKLNALLISKDRVYIAEENEKYPQEILNFFIVDCQNPNSMKVIHKWSSETSVCPVDLDNDILDVQFTDLDNDGNVEVWIVNEKYCRGGVDLTDLLVFKYEDREHCTLESMTNQHFIIDSETNSTMDDSFIRSSYEKEPLIFDFCFSNSDTIFLNFAKHLREKNIYGKGGFRFEKDGNDNPKFWNRN
jgi:hypothetical protein